MSPPGDDARVEVLSFHPFCGLADSVATRARWTVASARLAKLPAGIFPPFFVAVVEAIRLAAPRVMGEDLPLDISYSLWKHRKIAAQAVSYRGIGAPVEFSGKVARQRVRAEAFQVKRAFLNMRLGA